MPTYEYACSSCQHEWEFEQSIKDAPLTECPSLDTNGDGQGSVNEIIQAVNAALDGCSGFEVRARR